MRNVGLMAALGIGILSFGYAPGAAQATPARSTIELDSRSDGWEGPPRSVMARAPSREGRRRCDGCSVVTPIERGALPAPADPGIPEPSAAALFGLGLLALRSHLRTARGR